MQLHAHTPTPWAAPMPRECIIGGNEGVCCTSFLKVCVWVCVCVCVRDDFFLLFSVVDDERMEENKFASLHQLSRPDLSMGRRETLERTWLPLCLTEPASQVRVCVCVLCGSLSLPFFKLCYPSCARKPGKDAILFYHFLLTHMLTQMKGKFLHLL